ncbi:MAG TPA: hypothetical protein VH482_36745 [Thermomicrobiales bacterium]
MEFRLAMEPTLRRVGDERGGRLGYPGAMNRLGRLWTWIERNPRATDAATAAVFAVFALTSLRLSSQFQHPVSPWTTIALVNLLMLPLVWRRRFPLAVLVVLTGALLLYRYLDLPASLWMTHAFWLALYGAGAYGGERRRDKLVVPRSPRSRSGSSTCSSGPTRRNPVLTASS